MFIQVIEGTTNDADALRRRFEMWETDLKPGATGYLGSTGGCTAQGDCIFVARFENRDAARANSERPEQGEWWAATEACFSGPVTFHDTEDVELMTAGDLDSAHFVQVMDGHVTDRDHAAALEHDSEPVLAGFRPDLLGSVMAFFDGNAFTELAYFTSEDAARAGEQQEPTPEMSAMLAERNRIMQVDRFRDIPDPWLATA